MTIGDWTGKVADRLSDEFERQGHGYHIVHDHPQLGRDRSRIGKPRSSIVLDDGTKAMLADLDMAVRTNDTDEVFALVEVEEKGRKPKVLLGDILATLLGSNVRFRGRDQKLDDNIHLIVLAYSMSDAQKGRMDFLEKEANLLKEKLNAANAKRIGIVVMDTFRDELELESKLRGLIAAAWAERPRFRD